MLQQTRGRSRSPHNALVVDSETLQSPARYSNGKKMSIPTLEEQAQRSWL